jgi:hypothetical protein
MLLMVVGGCGSDTLRSGLPGIALQAGGEEFQEIGFFREGAGDVLRVPAFGGRHKWVERTAAGLA